MFVRLPRGWAGPDMRSVSDGADEGFRLHGVVRSH